MATGEPRGERSLRDLALVARRRLWLIVVITAIAAVGTAVLSLGQPSLYEATSEVLLAPPTAPASVVGSDVAQDPARRAETEAELARFPVLISRVLRATGAHLSPDELLADSDVSVAPDADLLSFSVRGGSRAAARELASAYALEFTRYHQQLDQAAFQRVQADLQRRVAELRAAGGAGTVAAREALIEREQELGTLQALDGSTTYLFKGAGPATRLQPRPLRNVVVGLLVGLLAGLGMAFVAETFDTRIRSASTIAEELRFPLLARIPESARLRRRRPGAVVRGWLRPLLARPPRPTAPSRAVAPASPSGNGERSNGDRRTVPRRREPARRSAPVVAMLTAPHSAEAEAFRMLRTRIELARADTGLGPILVTSTRKGEGKSTVAANLAVGFARSRRKVVAVDLDLRHPSLHRMFRIDEGHPGVTDVARGEARLAQALVQVPPTGRPSAEAGSTRRRRDPVVEVLAAGTVPVDPGELLDGDALDSIFEQLRARSDVVLVDTPPLLLFDDAMRLSRLTDAVLLVSRSRVTRSGDLDEVGRILASSSAPAVGFVVVGGDERPDLYYSYAGYRASIEEARRSM